MLYSHTSTRDLASLQSVARADRMSHSSKGARPMTRMEMQNTQSPMHGPGASLADMYRQRAFHAMGTTLGQASEISARHDSTLSQSHKPFLTASQGLHHAQRSPRQDCHSFERGRSLQGNPPETCTAGTRRALFPQHQARVAEGSAQQDILDQWGTMQPYWWQRLSSVAAACAVAALLTAGPPCSPAEARARLTQDEQLTIDVFKRNTPSVVYIENLALRRDQFTLDLMEKVPQGAGSGTIWDTEGHVVTNAHVIAGASDLQVSLMGDEEYPASVVGVDRDKDVAVLQLKMPEDIDKTKRLHPVTLGSSADLQVGQRVYAIGNPYGLDHTLTTGVISGTGREINSGNTGRPIENVIQTDAAINPGNSGGPLLDTSGELIGINTAIYSPSGANSGVGFAVPVDIIRSSVTQIIQFGKVLRPILGISFAPDQSVEQLQQGIQGILVLDARDGSPARLAGVNGTRRDQSGRLVLGDIISAFNGRKVKTGTDLYRELDRCSIGDQVDLEVLRGSEKVHLKVTLGSSS